MRFFNLIYKFLSWTKDINSLCKLSLIYDNNFNKFCGCWLACASTACAASLKIPLLENSNIALAILVSLIIDSAEIYRTIFTLTQTKLCSTSCPSLSGLASTISPNLSDGTFWVKVIFKPLTLTSYSGNIPANVDCKFFDV